MWKIGLFLWLGLFSLGCSGVDEIPSGELTFVSGYQGSSSVDGVLSTVRLTVDRQMQKAIFTHPDGTQQPFALILDAEPPVSACPTSFSHSLIEVVRTDLAELVVGDLRIVQPILVASCAINAPPSWLTLKNYKSSRFQSEACPGDENTTCFNFKLK